jgi:hypothetical protein
MAIEHIFITDDHIERDELIERDGQPCWCPDSFLEACFHVNYCPTHGSRPDPELWDHSTSGFPTSG